MGTAYAALASRAASDAVYAWPGAVISAVTPKVAVQLNYAGALKIYGLTLGRKDLREKVQRLCEPRVYSHEAASRDFGYAPVEFPVGVRSEIREYLAAKAPRPET